MGLRLKKDEKIEISLVLLPRHLIHSSLSGLNTHLCYFLFKSTVWVQAASHTHSQRDVIFLKYTAVIHCCSGAEWTRRWVRALFWFRCAARCGEVTFSWLFRSGSSAWESEFCFGKCCQNIAGYFFFQWKIQNRKNRWTRNLTSCQNKYFDLPFIISWHPEHLQFHKLWPVFLPPPLEASTFALLLDLYKRAECKRWWAHMGQNSSSHFLLLCFTKALLTLSLSNLYKIGWIPFLE